MTKKYRIIIYLAIFSLLFTVGCTNNISGEVTNPQENSPTVETINDSQDGNIEDKIEEIISMYYQLVDSKLYDISYKYLSPKSQEEFSLDEYKEYMGYQEKYNKLADYSIKKLHHFTDDNIIVELDTKRLNQHASTTDDRADAIYFEIVDNEPKVVLNDTFRLNCAFAIDESARSNNNNGDFELAIYDANLSKEIYPFNHVPYNELAFAYSYSGDVDAALEIIGEYIAIYAKIGEDDYYLSSMYRFRGMNLLEKGDRNGAITAYERALTIDPTDEYLKARIEYLRVMQ